MCDALHRYAVLAPTLKDVANRVLLFLTDTAVLNGGDVVCASSRMIADGAQVARRNVQLAIDELEGRGLIASNGSSSTRATTYTLLFLRTAVLEVRTERGAKLAPPPSLFSTDEALNQRHPGANLTPPDVLERGAKLTPPPHGNSVTYGSATKEDARASILSNDLKPIDRALASKPKMHDDADIATAREWLWGYMCKFGTPDAHPPDAVVCAQFLAVAPWKQLEQLLLTLMKQRIKPGTQYSWFVTVALNRIHGYSAPDISERRAQLAVVRKPRPPQPQQVNLLGTEPALDQTDFRQEIKQLARRKALR